MDELGQRTREEWNHRAQENARWYITGDGEDEDFVFTLSGMRDAHRILEDLHPFLRRDMRLLEIGCGIGRMMQFWSVVFREAWGIDASTEMVRQARDFLAGRDNVRLFEGDGRSLRPIEDASIDLAISYVVFQHIPEKDVIRDYVSEVKRVLVPGGIAKLHFKTGPWEGQTGHDTWFGVELSLDDWNEWNRDWGFETINSYSEPDSAGLKNTGWVIARKPR